MQNVGQDKTCFLLSTDLDKSKFAVHSLCESSVWNFRGRIRGYPRDFMRFLAAFLCHSDHTQHGSTEETIMPYESGLGNALRIRPWKTNKNLCFRVSAISRARCQRGHGMRAGLTLRSLRRCRSTPNSPPLKIRPNYPTRPPVPATATALPRPSEPSRSFLSGNIATTANHNFPTMQPMATTVRNDRTRGGRSSSLRE